MALGERVRGTGSSGVAQFLAEHQVCDAGFDVTRDQGPGSGRLRIACKGCGESVEYRAADAAEMASGPLLENGDAPAPPNDAAAAPAAPSASRSPSPGPAAQERRPPRRRTRVPHWLPNALIAALILAGVVLIAAGLLSSGDGTESSSSGDASERAAPAQLSGGEQSEQAARPEPRPPVLERRAFIGRFAIGVPRGWRTATPGGNVVLSAPGGAVRIRVYSDSPARDPQQLTVPTAGFLEQQHPGAQVSKPRRVRFGGEPGLRLLARFDGGDETATVLAASGFSFLVTYAERANAPAAVVREGEAAHKSFRPS